MKLSVSLPDEDVEFLDAYAHSQGISSRSAVVHKAVRLLKANELGAAYQDAWEDWARDGDADLWDTTVSDGISQCDEARSGSSTSSPSEAPR